MVTDIAFRRIPHQSELFLQYLELSPDALRFYHGEPSIETLVRTAPEISSRSFPRKAMAAILRRQNERFGAGEKTLRGIAELERPDCVAIVTGQQVGLFTGPLYTVYKAITAVRISEELVRRGVRAVPIFWMDTEDHDLAEVTRLTVPGADFSLQDVDYGALIFGDRKMPACSVGSISFPEAISKALDDYLSRFPDTEWKEGVRAQLESAYRPGSTLAQSFAQIICRLLPESGLILFDPQDHEARKLVSPLFVRAIREERALRDALVDRSRELIAAGFHSQVKILENSTILFFLDDGERRAIERRAPDFALKNSGRTFGADELAQCAEERPELFSPNVLLRPLVQDHLFPTLAYVGGSSELAYFAQIEVLYTIYGRRMPVIWPRNGFTLIEPGIGLDMDRLGLSLEDCFQGEEFMTEKALRGSKATENLELMQRELERTMDQIKPELKAFDPTLAQALQTARSKILHNVRRLKSHVIRQEGIRNASVSDAARRILNSCYPKSKLQEREFGIQQFLIQHGTSLLDTLCSETAIDNINHRVLHL